MRFLLIQRNRTGCDALRGEGQGSADILNSQVQVERLRGAVEENDCDLLVGLEGCGFNSLGLFADTDAHSGGSEEVAEMPKVALQLLLH